MKRSAVLKETLENMSMLKREDIEKVHSTAHTMLEEEPQSKKEWMAKELASMTHYFNEMDLEDEIHFAHESEME